MSRKKRGQSEVELNLAAMLDMAFQLLTFFIFTFRPTPAESQISMRLPPPQALNAGGKMEAGDSDNKDPVKGLDTLIISAFAGPKGELAGLAIGEQPLSGIGNLFDELKAKLKVVLSAKDNPFDQVIVQVGSELKYDQLMSVVEAIAAQTKADGKTPAITKLSFVENPDVVPK